MVGQNKNYFLLYRGTRDGFRSGKFHRLCDNKGATICLVKTDTNHVFGGYTPIPWTSSDGEFMKGKGESFVFKVLNLSQSK